MFETSLCQILFYVLAALAVLCAAGVVGYRNPVNSAMCMAVCFAMVAAIFFEKVRLPLKPMVCVMLRLYPVVPLFT